jgi:hypothetical protein
MIPVASDLKAAVLALTRALFNETITTDARIPIIAITTRSSMSVKPLLFDIFSKHYVSSELLIRWKKHDLLICSVLQHGAEHGEIIPRTENKRVNIGCGKRELY